jgi:hypothetical protein
MAVVTKQHIEAYLHFLEGKTGKTFPPESLARWNALPETSISSHLRELHQRLELNDVQVYSYQAEFFKSITSPKKGRAKWYITMGILLAALVAGGFYVKNKYDDYNSLGYIYTLADNVAVRQKPDAQSLAEERMDLYGAYTTKEGWQASFTKMQLLSGELENGFYKVTNRPSFVNYLLGTGSDNVRYVSSKFVTRREELYTKFYETFINLKDDYNEMDKLQYNYRAIIVNAIDNYPELKGLRPAKPCKLDSKTLNDAWLGIGQYSNSSKTEHYVLVQFSDGKYYSIESDGTLSAKAIRVIEEYIEIFPNDALSGDFKFRYNNASSRFDALMCGGDSARRSGTTFSADTKPYTVFRENPWVLR